MRDKQRMLEYLEKCRKKKFLRERSRYEHFLTDTDFDNFRDDEDFKKFKVKVARKARS